MNDGMAHLVFGMITVKLIQWAKVGVWTGKVTDSSVWLNRFLSGVAAALVALGITITGDASAGWTIHIPMVTVLVQSSWEATQQFCMNQFLYEAAVQRTNKQGEIRG